MKLTAFGETREWPEDLTLQGWMDAVGVENQEVALVQVNGRDIPPGDRDALLLRDGDRLQILYFLGDS